MLQKRVIVCLDVRDGKTVKSVKFVDTKELGDPVEMAELYYRQGVDELVFYDITASAENRSILIDVVRRVAQKIFIPFCVGGGIKTAEDIRQVILAGAEKVSLNSQAVLNPELIRQGARLYGSQSIVLAIDALADPAMPSGYRVVINGGRTPTNLDALEWARQGQGLGAGEIVLNSIDADGTKAGYDLVLTRLISQALPIPVVASGGAGTPEHLRAVLQEGKADAALVASMVHYGTYTVAGIKASLSEAGVTVRRDYLDA
ncbi:MAG: imidazole glycerol phosphate synthase subunit HisF [Spirochaetales bacterium]